MPFSKKTLNLVRNFNKLSKKQVPIQKIAEKSKVDSKKSLALLEDRLRKVSEKQSKKAVCKCGKCQKCTVKSCAPTIISKPTTITKSGPYCLDRNIRGSIVIDANNVFLDLNSHLVNGEGSAVAILVNNQQNVTITNGSVTNPNNVCIQVNNSDGVTVSNIQAYNTESAVQFLTVFNSEIDNVKVYNCLSTYTALILIDSSDSIEVNNVTVQNNTKTATAVTNELTPGTSFVYVGNSSDVNFFRVFANNNTFNNTIPLADPVNHWRTVEVILFISSVNCSASDCQTNGNVDTVGNTLTLDTEDYMFCILGCDNFVSVNHQSNNNKCTNVTYIFSAFTTLDSNNIIVDGGNFNENFAQTLLVFPQSEAVLAACLTYDYFLPHLSSNMIYRNCQANFNSVADEELIVQE